MACHCDKHEQNIEKAKRRDPFLHFSLTDCV